MTRKFNCFGWEATYQFLYIRTVPNNLSMVITRNEIHGHFLNHYCFWNDCFTIDFFPNSLCGKLKVTGSFNSSPTSVRLRVNKPFHTCASNDF